jgi:acyl-CoA synthetase (NDP forming)
LGSRKDKEACEGFLEGNRVPCYDFPEHAVRVFARMWGYGRVRKRLDDIQLRLRREEDFQF